MRSIQKVSPIFLFLLLALLSITCAPVRAADEDDADEYDETARVVRVSLIRGNVSLRRNGSTEWEQAKLNFPLVEGDTLATARDARVELQIDARNFVRVDENSVLRVVTLRDEGIALSLSEGTATLRLARFQRDREYFEVDAPQTTFAAEQTGVYRLDVEAAGGRVRLTVRDGGQARIYSETSGFTVRDGRTAELAYQGTDAGDWNLTSARTFDTWDFWVDERERFLASRLRYDQRDRYYDAEVWGAEELDAYGNWTYVNDYGWVWRPHPGVINSYNNWAPYRYGRWVWCPPYGWTWVGDEPWGWAPYHYGRWVYFNNGWGWAPRGYGYRYRRAWWRPALVAFCYISNSYGGYVSWYPLGHRQRDPRSRNSQQRRPLQPLSREELSRLERTNPAFLRAVTTQPAREFGQRTARLQPATIEDARRTLTTEPVRGRLPVIPAEGGGRERTNTGGLDGRVRPVIVARPLDAAAVPQIGLDERPTGASTRRPGVALDGELRRTRLYNNREPRTVNGADDRGGSTTGGGSLGGGVDTSGTGAVARPPRVRPVDRQPSERERERGNDADTGAPIGRPARPRSNPDEPRLSGPEVDVIPSQPRRDEEPAARPAPRRDDGPAARPEPRSEPRRESRPEPRPERRSEPRDEPRRESRPEPRQESRPERQQESRPEPRSEPQSESRSEPRSEPQPESRPEPAPAPAPAPAPRQEPEQREERPSRSERQPRGAQRR
jgi:hypothetical protein